MFETHVRMWSQATIRVRLYTVSSCFAGVDLMKDNMVDYVVEVSPRGEAWTLMTIQR